MPEGARVTVSGAVPAARRRTAGAALAARPEPDLAVPCRPTRQAGFAPAAGDPAAAVPPLIRHHWTFPAVPGQVRRARQALADVLATCPFAPDVVLCLSELVTNAVLHSDSGQPEGVFWVRAEVREGHSLLLEVGDAGGRWQCGADPDGRMHGLGIVEALAGQVTVRRRPRDTSPFHLAGRRPVMASYRFTARGWRSVTASLRWRLLWATRLRFAFGVTGIVRDRQGRVLLLRRRLRPGGSQWGLPAGYVRAGETFRQAIARVVRDGAGVTVVPGRLMPVRHESRPGAGIAYAAVCTAGELRPGPAGTRESAWFAAAALPTGLPDSDRALIRVCDLGGNKTVKETARSLAEDRVMTRSSARR